MNKIIVFQFLHFLFCRVLVRMSRLQQSYEYIIKRGPYFTHLLWKTKQFEVWTILIWKCLSSILVNLARRENYFLILPLSCKFCFNIFQFQVLISLCLKTCWLFIFHIYSTKFDLKCAWFVWNYWNVFCFMKTKIKSRLSEFVAEIITFVFWNSSHLYTIHVYLSWLRC